VLRWLPSLIQWFSEQHPPESTEGTPSPPVNPEEGEGETKSFFEHLDDLRKMIFRMVIALFIGFNLCLWKANALYHYLKWPLYKAVPDPDKFLQFLNVTDSFVVPMKISFYAGLLLTSPALLYFLSQFILPALRKKEKSLLMVICTLGTALFFAGAALCFFVIAPPTLKAFVKYSEWMGGEIHWTVVSYVEFITQFMLAMGVTFEIPMVLLGLVYLGIIQPATLRKGRKVCIAIAVVISAVVAPPDPLSMILMSLPLIALFEATIWVAWLLEKKRRKQAERTE
jgi:sec-independent protein translocase protein TatC